MGETTHYQNNDIAWRGKQRRDRARHFWMNNIHTSNDQKGLWERKWEEIKLEKKITM